MILDQDFSHWRCNSASVLHTTSQKSLNFENTTEPLEQIVVYDTVAQMTTTSQTTQEAGATAGGATGTSLQTHRVARHPNAVK